MIGNHYINPNVTYSRYAEPEELEADYTEVRYDDPDVINEAAGIGIEIRRNNRGEVIGALVDGRDTNTIIASSTGAGKTTYLLQYILSCIYARMPFVVHDPKNELYGIFYTLLMERGYRVRVINFREPTKGDRFNFLKGAAKVYKEGEKGKALVMVSEIASQLYSEVEDVNDKFWTETSVNLFLCYFCIAAEIYEPEEVNLQTIYGIHIVGMVKEGTKMWIQTYLDAHRDDKCYELGIPFADAPNDTRQSIHAVFSSGLVHALLDDDVADLTSDSSFSIDELVSTDKPTALFIITSDETPKAYSSIVAAIVETIYSSLIKYAQKDGKTFSRLPKSTHFIIDEAGHIKFNNINEMMTTSRGRGIRVVLVLQSLKQLNVLYGKDLTDIIIGNAQNFVYLSSTDMELQKLISDRCGNRINETTGKIEPLISTNDLARFRLGDALLLLDRHMPYRTTFPDLPSYKMLEPLERVEFAERTKLEKTPNLFKEKVKELAKEKSRSEYEARRDDRQKMIEMREKEMRKKAELPAILAAELDRIIRMEV
ncbi:MAG: type IV secretory system conjugative DNA transfer family protein [Lachnospiraceae bacterium]|nr:type IV secretory system conjugative DNA transfer family protein [Candidatus Colinaster scatohippi]